MRGGRHKEHSDRKQNIKPSVGLEMPWRAPRDTGCGVPGLGRAGGMMLTGLSGWASLHGRVCLPPGYMEIYKRGQSWKNSPWDVLDGQSLGTSLEVQFCVQGIQRFFRLLDTYILQAAMDGGVIQSWQKGQAGKKGTIR